MKLHFIIILFFTQIVFGQEIYYVSNDPIGSDSNDGTSEATPWETIEKVNSSLPEGKKVVFKRGNIFNKAIVAKTGCTYGAYGNGNKPKFGNRNSTGRFFDIKADNVTIENIEIESNIWVRILGFDNLTINNCYFHHYVENGSIEADANHADNLALWVENSDYFTLRNSEIRGVYNSRYQDMIVVRYNSQYSLIENNYIDGGSHVSISIRGSFKNENDRTYNDTSPNHTIIRNNHFYNHSHHGIGANVGAWKTLIEGNYFERSGTGIDSSAYYNRTYSSDGTIGSAIYNYGSGITRNNIIRRSGSNKDNRGVDGNVRWVSDGRVSEVFDQAIYNNVFWDNWSEAYKTGVYYSVQYGFPDNLKYENISFVNNAFGGSKNPTNEDLYIYKANTSKDYLGEYRNNSLERPMIRYRAGTYTAMTIADFNLSPPGNITASDNLHIAPNFVSPNLIPNDGDVSTAFSYFEPQPSSQLIDAGDFLTFTINSGSNSNKIKVLDTKFFIDGWGIVDGDNIQLGNEIVKITFIDYSSNTITVNKNISWDNNSGVSLPYSGQKPDIGAVEFNGNTTINSSTYLTPIIIQQPENKSVSENENIIFSTSATCNDEIGYQWWKYPFVSASESKISNTSKFSGATTNTLIINNVDENDDNTKYVCEIYNTKDPSNRWINSEITTLTVSSNSIGSNFETPIITIHPKSTNVNEGENANFTIEATCDDDIGYQWWKSPFVNENESKIVNSSKYLGATTNQLVIKDAQNTDADVSYVCEVYNKMDLANLKTHSDIAGLTVLLNSNSTTPMSELKVILEGSFQNNGMLTILNEKDILPKTQPYNISPFNYSSYQKVDVFTNNIVDWVLIELRSDENTLVKQFAALLRNDGIVLNSLGTQDFTNHSIEDGDYYLVIHHRNHLSIMSKNKIIINNSVFNYNFSTSVDQAYGTNSMVELENGYFAMYSGDGDANNIISKLDFGSVANNILTTGYEFGDIDMNGIINVLDYSNINKNISVKSHVP